MDEITYLVKIYFVKKTNKVTHAITDVCKEDDLSKLIGKVYYFDSDKKKIYGTCKDYEIINAI